MLLNLLRPSFPILFNSDAEPLFFLENSLSPPATDVGLLNETKQSWLLFPTQDTPSSIPSDNKTLFLTYLRSPLPALSSADHITGSSCKCKPPITVPREVLPAAQDDELRSNQVSEMLARLALKYGLFQSFLNLLRLLHGPDPRRSKSSGRVLLGN